MEYIKLMIVFVLGFLSCICFTFGLSYIGFERPLSFNILNLNEVQAPSDWVKSEQIEVYEDRIVINVEHASLSRYADTGSMKPVLDFNSNGIRIKPESEQDINVGDIVSFNYQGSLIVHRVVAKGTDEEGVYFITKGDNNSVSDGKIRFEDIEYVTVGLIW